MPDGESHQLIGGGFGVAPGREAVLLDLLDEGDPEVIGRWFAGTNAMPQLRTREGEVSVQCELVVDLGDPAAARQFLDDTYEPEGAEGGDTWVELHPLDEDERILRARLTLDGGRLSVSTTSEERVERVLRTLRTAFGDLRVISDERTPIDLAAMKAQLAQLPPGATGAAGATGAVDATTDLEAAAALAEFLERYERRWCDESIPALGGLTPRQAAADPTRRPELERLLASFESHPAPGAGGMRPDRIRQFLDL